jgi:hypothetical protein
MVAKGNVEKILIPVPVTRILRVTVKGTSPLICNKFSAKAKRQIEDKKGQKAKTAKGKSDPEAEYRESLYPLDGKGYGFKANAFKLAMVAACTYCDGMSKVYAKGAFFVMGDLLLINGKPHMREDMVRVPPGRGGADIRYRGEFDKWSIDLDIRFNANLISAEQVVNLLSIAGFHIGIGEMRPSAPLKPGTNGMFEVKTRR